MALTERQQALQAISDLRGGRTTVAFFNFDRSSIPPSVPGLSTTFSADFKEALFRVLKESVGRAGAIDLVLYTRGGDVNAVWPIVSLIREFDPEFEVLVPFRCHSSGTILALGARRIVMGPISELSPIDPSTGNQFNPVVNGTRLPISVEDVQNYKAFVLDQLGERGETAPSDRSIGAFTQLVGRLAVEVHPLALGNVHRAHQQIKKLASSLLSLHPTDGVDVSEIVTELASRFYSHLHMINRREAAEILGERVVHAEPDLADAMDGLLRHYEENFQLRKPFALASFMGDEQEKTARFIGAAVESTAWSYLSETNVSISQNSKLPEGVKIQVPPGARLPLVPGFERVFTVQPTGVQWSHNTTPKGITI